MRKQPGGKWVAYESDGSGFNTVHTHKKPSRKLEKSSQKGMGTKKKRDRSPSERPILKDVASLKEEIDEEPVPISREPRLSRKPKRSGRRTRPTRAEVGFSTGGLNLYTVSYVMTIVGWLLLIFLFSPQHSTLTNNLMSKAFQLIGLGTYVLPVGLVMIGLWVILQPSQIRLGLSLKRAIGIALFYVWLLTIMNLILLLIGFQPAILDEWTGGSIGHFLQQILSIFSLAEASIVLLAWLLVALVMIMDIEANRGSIIILGLLILTILVLPQHSDLINNLIHTSGEFLGWGIYILPVGLITVGLWLFPPSSSEGRTLSLTRLIGILLFFLWLLTVIDWLFQQKLSQPVTWEIVGGGSIGILFMEILLNSSSMSQPFIALLAWLLIAEIMVFDLEAGRGLITIGGLLTLMILFNYFGMSIFIVALVILISIALMRALDIGIEDMFKRIDALNEYLRRRLEERPSKDGTLPRRDGDVTSNRFTQWHNLRPVVKVPPSTSSLYAPITTVKPAKAATDWHPPSVEQIHDSAEIPPVNEKLIEDRASLPSHYVLLADKPSSTDQHSIDRKVGVIEKTLAEFDIVARVVGVRVEPSVTQFSVNYDLKNQGTVEDRAQQISLRAVQIAALSKDLALALSVEQVSIDPIPEKPYALIKMQNRE